MFQTFFGFEVRYWMRGLMVYVFLAIITFMVAMAARSDHVQIGESLENTWRNAPYVLQSFYASMSLMTGLMVTAFVNSAASRDFVCHTDQILFTKPLHKFGYLMGRFWGSTCIAIVPLLGVSLGMLLATWIPHEDPEHWGPSHLLPHLHSILVFAIPNTILFAVCVFAIAMLTRSAAVSFVGTIVILIAYSIAAALTADLSHETAAMLLDPFAISTFSLRTKYWTVAEKNTQSVGLTGMMLANRALWLTLALGMLGLLARRFSFAQRKERARVSKPAVLPALAPAGPISISPHHDLPGQFARGVSCFRLELSSIVKSNVFLVVIAAGLINAVAALLLGNDSQYGLSSWPVTYQVIDVIRGALYVFSIAVIAYYAGVVVWRERDFQTDEIQDALPVSGWVPAVAKVLALLAVLVLVQLAAILAGVLVQAGQGYTRFQLGLYAREMLGYDLVRMFSLTILAVLVHVLSSNKYLGYFTFVAVVIANTFVWRMLRISSRLWMFSQLPAYTYSDLYRFAPYARALAWFTIYWLLGAGLLWAMAVLWWPRGKETSWGVRRLRAAERSRGLAGWIVASMTLAWAGVGGWIFYNTSVVNSVASTAKSERRAADYELHYKRHQDLPQPRVTRVAYDIDIDPENRHLVLQGRQTIVNKTQSPIPQLHVTLADDYDTELNIQGATLDQDDRRLGYQVYLLQPPLGPGQSREMSYTVRTEAHGFENSLTHPEVVQNGTFFNNSIAPQLGYQPSRELRAPQARKRLRLEKANRMPKLERNCTRRCMHSYISADSDWVDVETIIRTSPDQIAVAPGSLVKEWHEQGKRCFHYHVDHPSLNFYSFISARYEVAREKWRDIDVEVYYHPEHAANVPNMMRSMRRSLEYYTRNFGPYAHKQARIIEFPRIAQFAQAFPGTMPYSEGIGFIANLKKPDDIDMVYYVVAHEMAHQWWAHQVMGAYMEGATVLSETLAQYSALMVMEQEYGRDMMRKFLRYEMDTYLRSRGRELDQERPLLRVDMQQGYVHYRKGSVVMYYLKEMIGEDRVNAALRSLVEQFGYREPPYANAHHLVDALKLQTPPELHYLFRDLFDDITLFANRTREATCTPRTDGGFDVAITFEIQKLKSDDQGKEHEVPADDWIEIGAFAAPEPGRRYGATLYRDRIRLASGEHTLHFVVDQQPDQAGVDPFALLIDRIPDDNLKKIRMTSEAPASVSRLDDSTPRTD